MLLTRLGISRLWGENPERLWLFLRGFMPFVLRQLAPGYGYGAERIPESGGGVVAANHFGTIDPALVGIFSTRTIYYMTKIELLDTPVIGGALRWTGCFSVRRGEGDRDSIRVARWLAREGHLVGMFIEGTRQKLGHPGPVHAGAAMIAMHEEVPIIPCGVDTFGWTMKHRRACGVVWGDPIHLDGLPRNGRGYKEGAGIVGAEIHRLWRLAGEAVAAGFPSELPDGSRRSRGIGRRDCHRVTGARYWPDEPWAAGPLGPLYRRPRA